MNVCLNRSRCLARLGSFAADTSQHLVVTSPPPGGLPLPPCNRPSSGLSQASGAPAAAGAPRQQKRRKSEAQGHRKSARGGRAAPHGGRHRAASAGAAGGRRRQAGAAGAALCGVGADGLHLPRLHSRCIGRARARRSSPSEPDKRHSPFLDWAQLRGEREREVHRWFVCRSPSSPSFALVGCPWRAGRAP